LATFTGCSIQYFLVCTKFIERYRESQAVSRNVYYDAECGGVA
jgi:hypothetical protein